MKLQAIVFAVIWAVFFVVNHIAGHKEEARWFFLFTLIHIVWYRIEILIEQNKKNLNK